MFIDETFTPPRCSIGICSVKLARGRCNPSLLIFIKTRDRLYVFRKILFICVGNICRSPTAALLMNHRLQGRAGIEVSSAGLQALVGRPLDPTAAELLRENGIDPEGHVARQATPSILAAADLVLVMEQAHHARIVREVPQVSGKTFLLGKWRGQREIPDPYRQHREAFEHVYRLIDDSVDSWVPYIK